MSWEPTTYEELVSTLVDVCVDVSLGLLLDLGAAVEGDVAEAVHDHAVHQVDGLQQKGAGACSEPNKADKTES